MKISFRPAWGLLLALPLLGVKCEKEDIAKAKANQFVVSVRVTGENLAGLGAEVQVNSRLNVFNPSPGPALTYSYASSVSQTYPLGTFGLQDDATITVLFRNVTCTSALRPAANSRLKLELLVNGVMVNVLELTAASAQKSGFTCGPYWTESTLSDADDWD